MAYVFSGVISPWGSELVLADLVARFGGVSRGFEEPFEGWAVAFQADHDPFDPAHDHRAEASPLLAWSRGWPGQDFAFMQVKCFGGVCEQRGFSFRDGEVLLDCDWEEVREGDDEAPPPLLRLLKTIGVRLETPHFEPFTRNYFPPRGGERAARDDVP